MSNKINATGTLQSALEIGITVFAAVDEFIDNTFDANGPYFRLRFNHDASAYYYDNGIGMSKNELNRAVEIHNRSEATNDKQGCKGVGLNHAMANFTRLQSPVNIISRKSEERMVDMLIDYPDYVEHNTYNPCARTDPSRVSEELFDKLVTRELQSETGTVIYFPQVHPDVHHELTEAIRSDHIEHSLLYDTGIRYSTYIKEGKSIKFIICDEKGDILEYDVGPIDPLCRDTIRGEHKEAIECEFYINHTSARTQTRSYFMLDGIKVYTKNILEGKHYVAEEVIPAEWTRVGKYTIDSAYSVDWLHEQRDIIEHIEEIDVDDEEANNRGGRKAIEKRKHKKQAFMGGLYFQRNKKIIMRVPIADKKSGDYPERPFYDNSRHILKYTVELDDYLDTQINKSVLREENIDKSIMNAYKVLRNNFAHKQYLFAHPPAPPAPPAPVVAPAPIPDRVPVPPAAPARAPVPVPPAAPARAPAPAPPPIAPARAPAPAPPVAPAPAPVPLPEPEPVIAHLRATLRKRIALNMIEHCNATPNINVNDQYTKVLSEIICISNGKGGDAQLARQLAFISNNDYTRLSQCVCDYYNRNYSDVEAVGGGSLLLAFYRQVFPNSELLVAQP